MMTSKNASALALLALAACAGAGIRVAAESKQGGDIVLVGSRESAMKKAQIEMARVCGGAKAYEVVEEGEQLAGDAGADANLSYATDKNQPTEWHVHYTCNSAEPPAPTSTPSSSVSASLPFNRNLY